MKFSRINQHGVCLDVETIRVPVPKPAYAEVRLAQLGPRSWRVGIDVGIHGNSVGCGGVSYAPARNRQRFANRQAAVAQGLHECAEYFREGPRRVGGSASVIQVAAKALNAWREFAQIKSPSLVSKETAMPATIAKRPSRSPKVSKQAQAARKKVREAELERTKKNLVVPPGLTSRTTPAGIAVGDPDSDFNQQRAAEFAGELEAKNGKHKANGKHAPEPVGIEDWQESPSGAIAALPVEDLVRHPINRVPTSEDVAARAASMQDVGQLEPVVVWQPPECKAGQMQILSGETRWLAAKQLGWQTLQGRIVTGIDHAQALQLLARYNGERKDLDPMQRARLAKQLMRPVADGGAALTREQAAGQVGLESPSAVSNLVSLLELPNVWQARVAAGELAPTWAREMVKVAHVEPVMKQLEEDWAKREDKWEATFLSRNHLQDAIDCICRRELREIPAAMKLDSAAEASLGIVSIDIATGRGKTQAVRYATNVDAFTELEEKSRGAKSVQAAAKAGRDEPAAKAEKKLTPAEVMAKVEEQAEQLARRIAGWRHAWLKELVAAQIEDQDWVASKFLLWVLLKGGGYSLNVSSHVSDAIAAVGGKGGKGYGYADWDEVEGLKLYAFLPGGVRNNRVCQRSAQLDEVVKTALKSLLLEEDSDPRMPRIPFEVVDDLARDYRIDLADEWLKLQAAGKPSPRIEAFLQLHQSAQLEELAKGWDIYFPGGANKGGMVRLLTTRDRVLPLPKSIKPVAPPKPRPGQAAEPKAKQAKGAKAAKKGKAR